MPEIFFTSDHQFGHKRIGDLAGRAYASVEDMDEALINAWNATVGPGDIVYHLGNFSYRDQAPYLTRLRGHKHLIRGNHDNRARVKSANHHWASVNDLWHMTIGGTYVSLCHYALRVWNRSQHGALHFYGHSRGNLLGDAQSCDVGVDIWKRPVTLDELRKYLADLPPRNELPLRECL